MSKKKALKAELRKIATQVYISEVKHRSGENSLGKLEKRFRQKPHQKNQEFWKTTSRVFYKYASGKTIIEDKELIDTIEQELPGTKRILTHPLWFILLNPDCDLDSINKKMLLLSPNIRDQIFQTYSPIRKKHLDYLSFFHICMESDIDALACFLLIGREHEILDNLPVTREAKSFTFILFFRLSYFAPFNVVDDELYEIIYESFVGRLDSLINQLLMLAPNLNLTPPPFIENRSPMHAMITKILQNARNHGFHIVDRESQLKFLFWAFIFGIKETEQALRSKRPTPGNQQFINKITSAYESNHIWVHLPNPNIDVFNNFIDYLAILVYG